VFDGLLHPHISIPYVQMGRSIALYTVSLLSRDSCECMFISQLMFLSSNFSWHHLTFMCFFHDVETLKVKALWYIKRNLDFEGYSGRGFRSVESVFL